MLDIDLVSQKETSWSESPQTFGGSFVIKDIQVLNGLLWFSLSPRREPGGRKRKWQRASISISLEETPKIIQALMAQVNKSYEVFQELGILDSDSPGFNLGAELDVKKLEDLLKKSRRARK